MILLFLLIFWARNKQKQEMRNERYSHYNFYDYNNVSDRYYDNLLDSYEKYNSTQMQVKNTKPLPVPKQGLSVSGIDVNSCSEEQLVALPGINVILAKRIIKIREEIGGFKGLDQFANLIGINSSIANKLSAYVIFEKPKYVHKAKRKTERNIDL